MKKLLIILLLPAFLSGCSMNIKAPSYENIINDASNNLSKLLDVDYKDIESDFGSPYKATYYIDADKLKGRDVDSLTIEDLKSSVISFASYEDLSSPNKFLNIFYENGVVKQTLVDDFENFKYDLLSPTELHSYDYRIDFNKEEGVIDVENFDLSLIQDEFVGKKTLSDFNKHFNVNSANFIASTINNTEELHFYSLVNQNLTPSEQNNYPNYQANEDVKLGYINPINNNISYSNQSNSDTLHLHSNQALLVYIGKDNIVKYINYADKNIMYGVITDILGPNNSTSDSK